MMADLAVCWTSANGIPISFSDLRSDTEASVVTAQLRLWARQVLALGWEL